MQSFREKRQQQQLQQQQGLTAGYSLMSSPATTATMTTTAATPLVQNYTTANEEENGNAEIMERIALVLTKQEINQAMIIKDKVNKVDKVDNEGLTHIELTSKGQVALEGGAYTFEMEVKEVRATENSKGFGFIESLLHSEFFYNKDEPTKHTVGGFSAPIGTVCNVKLNIFDPALNAGGTTLSPAASTLCVCLPGAQEILYFELSKQNKQFLGKFIPFSFEAVEGSQTFLFWVEKESTTVSPNPFTVKIYATYV